MKIYEETERGLHTLRSARIRIMYPKERTYTFPDGISGLAGARRQLFWNLQLIEPIRWTISDRAENSEIIGLDVLHVALIRNGKPAARHVLLVESVEGGCMIHTWTWIVAVTYIPTRIRGIIRRGAFVAC